MDAMDYDGVPATFGGVEGGDGTRRGGCAEPCAATIEGFTVLASGVGEGSKNCGSTMASGLTCEDGIIV